MGETAKKRVMIVDDAALVRLYYRSTLEQAGFHVEEALNGVEALEKLLTAPCELLIVDVNMPQMDGLTFISAVRRLESAIASVPVLVTSSESGSQDIAAARAAGANFYLVKPLSREKLAEYAAMLGGASA
jgi:two-component system chemotaxis response regulator CheY